VALRALALTALVTALARPRSPGEIRDVTMNGRNIVLALDVSSSMKARDFAPDDRITAAKRVLERFIDERPGDFMGLVVFASRPFTQAPLTDDRAVLLDLLQRVDIGILPDGTAIGTALAMAENHLKDLPRRSGVIVLITDGGNNTGTPDPIVAAQIARAIGVRIYAIGMSARRGARMPGDAWVRGMGQQYQQRELAYGEQPAVLSMRDEQLLRTVASVSGGTYYRASDLSSLDRIVRDIDRAEKSRLRERQILTWHEHVAWLLVPALIFLCVELTLRSTWLRTVP
jgi:Ca-activated chloride channel family protein